MITFRYKEEPVGATQIIKRPVADVYLRRKDGTWIEFHPYIDSGADVTLIPLTLGKLLGFSVDDQKIEEIGGIRGSVPIVYKKNRIRIGNMELTAKLGWALSEDVPPLLGRSDIFEVFNITFRQSEGIITFEKLRSQK